MRSFWVLACFAFSLTANAVDREGGNGSDPLVLRFKDARAVAIERLKHWGKTTLDPAVDGFLSSNASYLAEDVQSAPHVWTETHQPTCARTGLSRAQPITLSFSECKGTTLSEAVEVLIHESVHHFGFSDENFAYRVARAVVSDNDNQPAFERNWGILASYVEALKHSQSSEAIAAREALSRYRAKPRGERGWETHEIVHYRQQIAQTMMRLSNANKLTVTHVRCPQLYSLYQPKQPIEGPDWEYGSDYVGVCKWPETGWTTDPEAVTYVEVPLMYVFPVPPEYAESDSSVARMAVYACTKRQSRRGTITTICSFYDMWSGEIRDQL